jgi:hypothetical protein
MTASRGRARERERERGTHRISLVAVVVREDLAHGGDGRHVLVLLSLWYVSDVRSEGED